MLDAGRESRRQVAGHITQHFSLAAFRWKDADTRENWTPHIMAGRRTAGVAGCGLPKPRAMGAIQAITKVKDTPVRKRKKNNRQAKMPGGLTKRNP